MTVTGTMRLFSSQTWVMPSLVPSSPFTLRSKVMSLTSELDLDVDASRQVETHQRVDGLRRGVDDVDEALVRAHLEVLAGVLVLVRRADDAVHVLLGRQRHRAGDLRTRAGNRVHDLARRGVDHLVVIGLEPDADLLSRHLSLSTFSISTACVFRDVLRLESVPPVLLTPSSDPRGRACRTPWLENLGHNTRPGISLVLLGDARRFVEQNRVSRFGAATRQTLKQRETRFSSQDVVHPGNPPKQPNYLDRDLAPRQIHRPLAPSLRGD